MALREKTRFLQNDATKNVRCGTWYMTVLVHTTLIIPTLLKGMRRTSARVSLSPFLDIVSGPRFLIHLRRCISSTVGRPPINVFWCNALLPRGLWEFKDTMTHPHTLICVAWIAGKDSQLPQDKTFFGGAPSQEEHGQPRCTENSGTSLPVLVDSSLLAAHEVGPTPWFRAIQ